jgi:adenylate cyclase
MPAHELNPLTIVREAVAGVPRRDLSQRMRDALRRHAMTSEILVKLIQLAVVLIWTGLYAAAPKTDAGTAFSPVPYALAAYLVINAVGLWWAMRRNLPAWAVYLSIALDMAVLMLLIWSFHIQYGQPASFYLKAPTLLYVFIFIALRALRFEARFVLAAGLFAALGWLVLAAYVILTDAERSPVTRDYVTYITDNAVLIGAEIDKIVSILMVTGILALALRRADSFLSRATSEGITARELARFFDAPVASRIRDAAHGARPGEGTRRNAAILFIDIRSFTPLAAGLAPGEVVSLLTAYQTRIVPIIHRHGGTIDKFLGDGIMATFGAVDARPDFAAAALRALDDIVADCESWPEGSGVLARLPRGAVNGAAASGEVIFGTLGNEERLEYTVIGAPVNLAAKLEKFNRKARARALTDSKTFTLARAQGYAARPRLRRLAFRVSGAGQAVVLHESVPATSPEPG